MAMLHEELPFRDDATFETPFSAIELGASIVWC